MARKKNTNLGDDTQRQDEGFQFTYGLQYNAPAKQLGLSPAVTKPGSKNAVGITVRRRLLTTKSIRHFNPSIALTGSQNANARNVRRRLLIIESVRPVNASIDVTGVRLSVPPEHHVQDDAIVRTHRTTNRTTIPISTVFDHFRNLKMPKIKSNFVADIDTSSSRITRRRLLNALSKALTDQNDPNVDTSTIGSSSAQRQADTPAYMDLGSLELQKTDAGGDVLRFKIRLYSMGDVRGYELPTSGVLGGTLFEDGPKSRIDFDVIIEFRGGPP
nr:helitron helicase-like domain-containing protein [Tanacetum cinerariifolium]GFA02857.1 helitron helicase-like domain-containing protein [Tanacetum cinerariifolium]